MEFPCIQSHERFIHKVIPEPDCIYLAQPAGKRCYAWFTYSNRPICYIVDKQKILYSIDVIFNESLSKGTILYGTIVHYNSKKYFIVDNIFHYKGEILTCNYSEKLKLITEVFTTIQNYHSQWLFLFPETSMHMKLFHTIYKIYCIKIIQLYGNKIFNQTQNFT